MVVQPDSARQILGGLSNPNTPVELRTQAYLALADYYFNDERWEPAIDEFRNVLESDSDDEWIREQALIKVGECLKQIGQYKEALGLYESVLSQKLSRALRFAVNFQHSVVLMELEQYELALTAFENLLRDGAFYEEFPKIEVEAAQCERKMERYKDARERLEKLIETESKGSVAAEAQYELGLLLWTRWRELKTATEALKEVKSTDRNSPLGEPADSLLEEIETLSKYWQRLGYFNRQIGLIDSAQNGNRLLLPSDTSYIDSVSIILKDESKRSKRNSFSRRDDPMKRMIEKAMKEQEEEAQDTTETAEPDTTAPLDSMALVDFYVNILSQRNQTYFDMASYYLFQPESRDSARYYFNKVIEVDDEEDDIWGRVTASLAYLARTEGDSVLHDSLLGLILTRLQKGDVVERARKVLGLSLMDQDVDSIEVFFQQAEDHWYLMVDPMNTRDLYLQIADKADSSSDIRARALLAAAYVSIHELGEDSIARGIYKFVQDEFHGTDYSRKAKDVITRFEMAGLIEKDQIVEREDEKITPIDSLSYAAGTTPYDDEHFRDDEFDIFQYEYDMNREDRYEPDMKEEIPEKISVDVSEVEVDVDTTAAVMVDEAVIDTSEEQITPLSKPDLDTYTVTKGDNLWNISGKAQVFSNPYKWQSIYNANLDVISNPDLIYPGQRLTIPHLNGQKISDLKTDTSKVKEREIITKTTVQTDELKTVLPIPDKVYDPDQIDELPMMLTGLDTLKNLLKRFYPVEAMNEGIRGVVEIEFVVRVTGGTDSVAVVSVDPEEKGFDGAARNVLEHIEYKPGRYRGHSVSVRIKQRFVFERK